MHIECCEKKIKSDELCIVFHETCICYCATSPLVPSLHHLVPLYKHLCIDVCVTVREVHQIAAGYSEQSVAQSWINLCQFQ